MKDQVTLDNTIGAAFLGASASCILFGITIVQTQLYYHNFPKDWTFQKASVATLVIFATFHLIFTLHAVYFYIIVNFGNLAALQTIVWSFKGQLLINTLTALLVQGLYAMRVWKFGRNFSRFWSGFAVCIVAGGWAVGIFAVVKSYKQKNFTDLDSMRSVLYAAPITATSVDMIIAAAMCYYLNRSRTSFVRTNNKIFNVMRYVLISGFLTSACSLCTLITYATMPHNLVFIGIDLVLPNLYINSYIAMLNTRKSMNDQETLSLDISKVLNMRPGSTMRTNDRNIHSVDDKMFRDGILLSPKGFTFNESNKSDQELESTRTLPSHGHA